jgi:hypothetical protein
MKEKKHLNYFELIFFYFSSFTLGFILPYTTIKDNVVVVAVVVAAVADVDAVETFNQVKCPHTHILLRGSFKQIGKRNPKTGRQIQQT